MAESKTNTYIYVISSYYYYFDEPYVSSLSIVSASFTKDEALKKAIEYAKDMAKEENEEIEEMRKEDEERKRESSNGENNNCDSDVNDINVYKRYNVIKQNDTFIVCSNDPEKCRYDDLLLDYTASDSGSKYIIQIHKVKIN